MRADHHLLATTGQICVGIKPVEVCFPDPVSLLTVILNDIAHSMGGAFAAVTAPFAGVLTASPDLSQAAGWEGVRGLQGSFGQLAALLFVAFLTMGVFTGYLSVTGTAQTGALFTPLRRAVLVTGAVAGYPQLARIAFAATGALTTWITGLSIGGQETGFAALAHAFGTLDNIVGVGGLIDLVVLIVGLIIALVCVVIRQAGEGALAVLYAVGPFLLLAWMVPAVDFVARWWIRTTMGLILWPVGYALTLKVIENLLGNGGAFGDLDGLVSGLSALGLLLLLLRVPLIVGSLVGAGASVIAVGASALSDAGIQAGRRLALSKLP